MRRTAPIARIAALLAVTAAAVVAALLLLGGGGGGYTVKARFQNASQLVKGNLVQVSGPARRQGQVDRAHAGRPGAGHDERQRRLRAAAPRHEGDRPPGLAVGHRQPLRRPHAARPRRREDPRRRRDRAGRDDLGGRPRPDLQHVRRPHPEVAAEGVQGLGPAAPGQGRGAERGAAVPQPLAGRLEPAVPRAQPRHAAARALHRRLLRARHRRRRPARRPRRAGRQPRHDDDRDRRRAGRARGVDRAAAAVHAPRQHDVPQPARRARRPRPARRGLQAGGEEAAPVHGRAAAAGARRPADPARPLGDPAQAGRRQRRGRPHEAPARRCATPRWPTSRSNGKTREGAFPATAKSLEGLRARARLRAPLRAGRGRLVRRLQPLRHLRRARRRLARGHPRERVHAAQRAALAGPARAAQRRRSRPSAALNQRNRCPGGAEHPAEDGSAPYKPTPDFDCDPSQVLPGK